MIQRKIEAAYTPAKHQGFMGPDHTARALIQGSYQHSDPFILLMDDVLDKSNGDPVGGPHPHAGFETVTLLLDGQMGDPPHQMKKGDFQLMTAGSGIVHTETIDTSTRMRLLQLWLNLPAKDRWAPPRLQELSLSEAAKKSEDGIDITLYSGSLAGLTSSIANYTPFILAEIVVRPLSEATLEIPARFNGLLVMLEGSVLAGEPGKLLARDEVGWLDVYREASPSQLKLKGTEDGARLVLYAGQPLGEPIVSHGPFIADSEDQIKTLYRQYREGRLKHILDT